MPLCADNGCNCAIVSSAMTITGSGQQGDPWVLSPAGMSVVTSGTRPGSPFTGQQILETDTARLLYWTGSAWRIVGGAYPKVSATRLATDAPISIANNTATDATMLNEVYDTDAFRSGTSAVFTIPTGYGGRYDLSAQLVFAASAVGLRTLRIAIAGNTSAVGQDTQFHSGGPVMESSTNTGLTIAIEGLQLEAGATVTLQAIQVSGGALNLTEAGMQLVMVEHIPTLV